MEATEQLRELYTGEHTIELYPAEILQQEAAPIAEEEFGVELILLGQQMIETMRRNDGVGLAGPQIGIAKRIFVMQFPNKTGDALAPAVLCNPVLELGEQGWYAKEGCLSLPGVHELVHRSREVFVTYRTPYGETRQMVLLDMEARIAQHEADHLDGVLFFERMPRNLRRALLRKWEKTQARRA